MVHVWRILRHEKKWSAYVKKLSNEKDKSATPNPAQVVNVEVDPKQHPVGHKKAKQERNGKRPAPEAISAIDQKLDKFIEVCNKAEKMAEVQEGLANKKLEAAQLNHKTAQEQTKCKMLDLYKELLSAPTNDLSEEALAERSKAIESMRLALFSKDN
uniref:No apical meristem-associated C-terminal domain-containing protein n=2 Tax=Setaria italica TaxID=4555 RepID=K3XMF5_SETIT